MTRCSRIYRSPSVTWKFRDQRNKIKGASIAWRWPTRKLNLFKPKQEFRWPNVSLTIRLNTLSYSRTCSSKVWSSWLSQKLRCAAARAMLAFSRVLLMRLLLITRSRCSLKFRPSLENLTSHVLSPSMIPTSSPSSTLMTPPIPALVASSCTPRRIASFAPRSSMIASKWPSSSQSPPLEPLYSPLSLEIEQSEQPISEWKEIRD